MQVQTNTCNYYPSNVSPYSPVATASVGTDSNNSSPESVYTEQRTFAQQRHHQLMDLSSPVSAHQHHHPHNVHATRHHHHHHVQSAKLQNIQTNLAADGQYYAHQNYGSFNGQFVNGSYNVVNEQKTRYYSQQQQLQQQQQPINRYNNGYSSPPTAGCQRTFVQQQQHHQQQQQHQHQVYAQPQLSPIEQFAVNAQLPHQTYSSPEVPTTTPTATFDYTETTNFLPQSIAVGKQRVVPIANRVKNNTQVKNNKKRKATDDGDVTMQITKMAKIEEASPTTIDEGIEDIDDQRLTASKRERQRTQELNKAYSQLRQTIPCLPSDKLSKIQTVKLAKQYIEFLSNVLYFNAMPEAMRQTHASPKTSVIMAARDVVESAKTTPNVPPSHDKLSYAFSVWRMDNEMTGTTRVE